MSALKIFTHNGDEEKYVGRLAFDGREVYAEPEPGFDLSKSLDQIVMTRNATYTKEDGDAFLRAMPYRNNAYMTYEYIPDDDDDETPFEQQDDGSFRHPRTGETHWGDQWDPEEDDDEPSKYAAVENPAFRPVSKGMTATPRPQRPAMSPASGKPLPLTTKPPVPATPQALPDIEGRSSKPNPLPALPQWVEGRYPSGRTHWTHRTTGERRTQDRMPMPQRLKPETIKAREAKAASPAAVTLQPNAKRVWDNFLPHQSVTPESAGAMVGAPNGSDINVTHYGGSVNVQGQSHQVQDMHRTLSRDSNGKLMIDNNHLVVRTKHQGGGLGQQIFSKQVQNAFNHGIDQIKTIGGKARNMNGYATWPKFGYNAPLNTMQQRAAKHIGIDAKDVIDLQKTKAGQDLWKRIGDQIQMTFDLTPGSKSMQQLAEYRQAKGLPPLAINESDRRAAQAMRNQPHHLPRSNADMRAMQEGFTDDDTKSMHDSAANMFGENMKAPERIGQPNSEKHSWKSAYDRAYNQQEDAVRERERAFVGRINNVDKHAHPDLVHGLADELFAKMSNNPSRHGPILMRWGAAYHNALKALRGESTPFDDVAKAWMNQHVPEVKEVEPERHEKRDSTNELILLLRRWGPSDPRSIHYAQSVMALLDQRPELRRNYSDSDLAYLKMLAEREPRRFEMTKEQLAEAVKDVATPTEGQKDAGNYKKGHVWWKGLDISIETPAGKSRNPEWPPLKDHYGYIKRTLSKADGDHVDVFLCDDHLDSDAVFVVNQINPDGKFDEHKCILGQNNLADAKAAYLRNYSSGWKCGPITPMTISQFKGWLEDGDTGEEVEPLKYGREHVAKRYAREFNDALDADRPVTREMREQANSELAGGDHAINYAAGKWEAMSCPKADG